MELEDLVWFAGYVLAGIVCIYGTALVVLYMQNKTDEQ